MKHIKNFFSKLKAFFDKVLPKPKTVTLENGTTVDPPRSAKIYVSIILLVVIYYFLDITNFDIVQLIRNFTNIFEFIFRIFSGMFDGLQFWLPEFAYWEVVLPKIIETVRMALLGTFIGSIFSLPVAYFISSNIHKNSRFGLFFINIAKAALSLVRTFPMLVYAQIISLIFLAGSGAFVGTIAIAIFTFSILTKMLYEYIETLDLGAFEAIESTGVTKGKAFTTAIMPEILPVYFSYTLYCFDINVRHSTILGYVGAGGIGVILKATLQSDQYEKAGIIMLAVFFAVLSIEAISKAIRRRLA
ncbi:Phosphate-import permease protein PhnE [Candidatus Izimaplasma bacterium HR1]|jgi:phosphonate transport system permease protein|uniref:PhnE/PtxC family ABC transporter permease n=1 Tax=Candidatus Izimoplasma sp. HR1 TaxID=1541959 RepID=UPI0004F6F991|nr:Phosphate-import permease protein PhnE [Candidatus Izimaplasma bacterium HR1]